MMRAGVGFLVVAIVVIGARLCHSHVLWADDNLPLAAAIQVAHGKTLYRDVWFDKPPLVAWIALLWGAKAGVALRLAGAGYVLAAAVAAQQFVAKTLLNPCSFLAFLLAAFFLTFGIPSAVIPLASDMLLVLPHFLAIYFAWRGRAFWSGAAAGVGLLCSSKAVFVLAACALWQWRSAPLLLIGFAAPNVIALGWMWLQGSATDYYREVWQWGSIYAANTFVENPFLEGVRRTADWMGFHAALVVGAIAGVISGGGAVTRGSAGSVVTLGVRSWRMTAWIAISFIGVVLGLRFFPRYYFLLLPPMIIAATRGWSLLLSSEAKIQNRRLAIGALAVLLAIPLVRFAPSYVTAARGGPWRDLDIDRDSQRIAGTLRADAKPGDTLFVWGFRPDIFVYSGLPAGTRFLESQPISGVLADRHLFSSTSIAPEFTGPNRAELVASHPTWIVDGLGVYNPALALARQSYLTSWLSSYQEAGRSGFSILYRLR